MAAIVVRIPKVSWLIVFALLVSYSTVEASEAMLKPSPDGGGWLEFTDPGGYGIVEDHPDFDENLSDGFRIEMWFYMPRDFYNLEGWTLLEKAGSYRIYLLGFLMLPREEPRKAYPNGVMFIFSVQSEFGASGGYGSLVPVTMQEWHHLVFDRRGASVILWLDGRPVGTTDNIRNDLRNSDTPLYIGGAPYAPIRDSWENKDVDWTQYNEGLIDGVKITRLEDWRVSRTEGTQLASWHFDSANRIYATDSSPNRHRLRLVNARPGGVEFTAADRLSTAWATLKRVGR